MEFAAAIWNLDPSDQAIDSLRAYGVTAVEFGPSFLYHEDEAAFVSAAARYRAAGIRFYAVHAPFDEESDLSHLDEGKRRGAVATHVLGLARAALAGAECMVIHPSRHCLEKDPALCQPRDATRGGAGDRRSAGPGKHAARSPRLSERRRAAHCGRL
jgi:sugar phosphate isomerase/epimerase